MMKSTSSFDGWFQDDKDNKNKERTTPPQSPPSSACDATEPPADDSASSGYHRRTTRIVTTTTTPTSSSSSSLPQPPKILWSCIARDDTILAEANDVGRHDRHNVADAARQLLQQRCTPGFEYHTQNKLQGLFKNRLRKHHHHHKTTRAGGTGRSGDGRDAAAAVPPLVPLKGIKFHVFEHISDESMRNLQWGTGDDDDSGDDRDDETATTTKKKNGTMKTTTTTTMDAAAEQRESTPHLRVWVFAAIYDPNCTNRHDVQSFLEKLVHITDSLRTYDPEWKVARTLGLQASFAPTLQQRMEEVTYLGKVALLQQQIHACQEQMENNIDLMLENTSRAEDLNEEASHLMDMCQVFKKKAKEVKRQHMLANAKYGLVVGTAATGLAAVVIVPLVVAL